MGSSPATVSVSSGGVVARADVSLTDPSPTTSARFGNTWLADWWVEALGSPDNLVYDAFGNLTSDTAPTVPSLFLYTARPPWVCPFPPLNGRRQSSRMQ